MTYCQDLDTGEIIEMERSEAGVWAMSRLVAGHKPYLSETPIPAKNGASYRRKLTEEWSV